MRAFNAALGDVDCVWLLGPHPLAIVFAVLAAARRRRVVLGVRQDMRAYTRARHPNRRALAAAANVLDLAWRALSRLLPVVVVGPAIAAQYEGAKALLEIAVSLIDEADVVDPRVALARPYDGELRVISVGRLEAEKNPLLLADILERLARGERRWRLVVCGEGGMKDALAARFEELDVADRAELRGYVPFGGPLLELYRTSHALLHVSWTEGLPQVLFEGFAAGIPVVATEVGGVSASLGEAVRLVPPGDADAAARELAAIAADAELRRNVILAGHREIAARTANLEADRVARFLRGEPHPSPG